ncbi:helix-turn-helix domain-containing protein [Nakamurella sp. YIM 132087]|uniref:Helix-turn-helix domain-containing protein n=1 Tax=Nakamurella alba TaxID=2665158 RepID=A0A7K1FLT8_9ACTN|nr:helix-turn-helix domain-containing protein [Nakamurella alba]
MPALAGLGSTIAARRVQLRLTQQDLADLAGVSRSSIQALEYGSGGLRLAALVEVASVLGLQVTLESPFVADR